MNDIFAVTRASPQRQSGRGRIRHGIQIGIQTDSVFRRKPAGVMTLGISLRNQQVLDGAAEHLAVSSGEVRAATEVAAELQEIGRAFGVVAAEIRKMAESSVSCAREIENILTTIRTRIGKLDETLIRCSEQSEQQAAATQQIAASMEQLAESATGIEEIAKLL